MEEEEKMQQHERKVTNIVLQDDGIHESTMPEKK